MLGRILCTCTAAKLPLRSFLGRSCKSVYRDAPDNYLCSISVGKTDCLGAPNNYFAAFPLEEQIVYAWYAQLPNSPCVLSWDAVARLFIVARLTTTSAAFPLAEQIVYAG